MNNATITVSNISKRFGDVNALNDVSAQFSGGNLYGVIGPAGAGKTTLFRIILRLMRANAGAVKYHIDGTPIAFDDVRDKIAYMPQSQSLYSDLSVDEHLDFFRRLYGINDSDFKTKKRELLQLTRLEKFLGRPAGKLSGGMYKKLGLMCALLRSPQIMLLDEPTNGVDPISRREFWGMLNVARQSGILVIMSTAYMDEAERCDDVILMNRGRILDMGEPKSLLQKARVANFDELFLTRGAV